MKKLNNIIEKRSVVIFTVGFSADLILRSLLKIGLKKEDVVILIYSLNGDEKERKRVEDAVRTIKSILTLSNTPLVTLNEVVVTGSDFVKDIGEMIGALKKLNNVNNIIASIVGGMRLLVFEVITMLSLYRRLINSNVRITYHVMREDSLYDELVPSDVLDVPNLGTRELEVLKILSEVKEIKKEHSELVNILAKEMDVSESMVYKVLNNLEKKNIITFIDNKLTFTLLGRLILKTIGEQKHD